MGNITNLATTGNYATEANGIKVSFDFQIDNESKALKVISNGQVTEDGKQIATFNMDDRTIRPIPEGEKLANYSLPKGREVEVVTYITDAVKALEGKIKQGEEVAAAV